jgi:hypothetical protein
VTVAGAMNATTGATIGIQELRGKAIEAIGIIAEAVGGEVFQPDAADIMQCLLICMQEYEISGSATGSVVADGDGNSNSKGSERVEIIYDYILPACARISKVLGINIYI